MSEGEPAAALRAGAARDGAGSRGALLLRAYYVTSYTVGGVYLPFFPRWLEGRGMHGLELGVVCAATPAMGLVAPALFGVVADALSLRVGLLQLACAGTLVAFGSLASLVALSAPLGFWSLLAAALFISFFRSPMIMIADVVALERAPRFGTTYGRIRLWGSLGFLVTAQLASLWIDPRDPLEVPAVCTLGMATGFVASLTLPRKAEMPKKTDSRGMLRLLAEEDFRLLLVAVFLSQCGHAAYDTLFSIRLFDLGIPRPLIGLAWAIGTGAEVAMMAWSAPAFRSYPAPRLLAFAFAAASLRWVLLGVVTTSATILLLQPLHALSFGLVWIAAVSFVSHRFSNRSLATAQGLLVTSVGAGSIVGMLVWPPVYVRLGGAYVFGGAACFAAVAAAFAVALDRTARALSAAR